MTLSPCALRSLWRAAFVEAGKSSLFAGYIDYLNGRALDIDGAILQIAEKYRPHSGGYRDCYPQFYNRSDLNLRGSLTAEGGEAILTGDGQRGLGSHKRSYQKIRGTSATLQSLGWLFCSPIYPSVRTKETCEL